ncbi:hypothetical protein [Oleiharenicola lentus]|uniref:hypothetical protein n=1 Tax=Oleiharenicola lentus TaxID=2508720 RepID=UPI003F669D75
MKPFASVALLLTSALVASAVTAPVSYTGELNITTAADGGLRPAVGVQNIQVYRANRTAPTHVDQLSHTYQHAPMLAYWRGKFYLEFLSATKNEHDNPTDTSLTTSVDGLTWDAPKLVFPAFKLANGEFTVTHQRMGFYTAPDGRLLALAFHGKAPSPNDGTGVGRVVREIHADGSFGPIYFIRLNAGQTPADFKLPYPSYRESPDQAFVAACEALLANKLMTVQWWEEDQLDETGLYAVRGKALSYIRRPDNSVLGIWKNSLVATTKDEGVTWTEKVFAGNMPNNASKYWLQATADKRFALFLNPTNRLRHPLAVMTSADSANFSDLLAIHGELPDQRFGGKLKNMGPQYVRGIEEGNGTPPDSAAATWITYSVNKEDIWVSRVPVPIAARVHEPVNDTFESDAPEKLPTLWNSYSPLWAPVRVIDTKTAQGRALELRDEDPYDYARAVRIFPTTHGVKVSFKIFAAQKNARLEIDLLDARGARPVRLALAEDGHLWACHEGQWFDGGVYAEKQWQTFSLEIPVNPSDDRCTLLVDGNTPLARPMFFTDPMTTVERLSFRTGEFRERGYGGRDLPGADKKSPTAVFLIDDVTITPLK